jgi:hypothetical protein
MPGRTSFRAAAVIGSILLLAGCDDERAPVAQAPAAKPAVASPAPAPAPAAKPAAKPDPTFGLAVVKAIELREWSSEAPAYTNMVSLQQGTEGQDKPLTISFSTGEKDKAAVRKSLGTLAVPAGGVMVLQVTNPNSFAVPLAIAVKTGKTWTYHESERMTVAPGGKGPQQLVIDLAGSTFKSEASQWKNNSAISDLDQVKELQICIYSQKQPGEIIVNAVDIRAKP